MSNERDSPEPPSTLVNTRAIRDWLDDALRWPAGYSLTGVRVQRVWRSSAGRVTFELCLTLTDGQRETTTLLQGGLGQLHRTPKNKPRFLSNWVTGIRQYNADLELWVCSPDRDPALHVDRYFDPVSDRIIAYRTHKRCVLFRANAGFGQVGWYMKFFASRLRTERLGEVEQVSRQLADHTGGFVRTAPIVAIDRSARMIASQQIRNGAVLSTNESGCALAARVASELHKMDYRLSRIHTPIDEVETVRRWERTITRFRPDVAPVSQDLTAELLRLAERLSTENMTPVHRDFYDAQMMCADNTLWILDMDTLAMGHPEQDVATFCAHCLFDLRESPRRAARCASELISVYKLSGGRLDENRLRFYLAAAVTRVTLIHTFRGLGWADANRLVATARTFLYSGVEAGLDRFCAQITEDRSPAKRTSPSRKA